MSLLITVKQMTLKEFSFFLVGGCKNSIEPCSLCYIIIAGCKKDEFIEYFEIDRGVLMLHIDPGRAVKIGNAPV